MRINISLKQSTLDLIDKWAEDNGVSRSVAITMAINSFAKQQPNYFHQFDSQLTMEQYNTIKEKWDNVVEEKTRGKEYTETEVMARLDVPDVFHLPYYNNEGNRMWVEMYKHQTSLAKKDNKHNSPMESGERAVFLNELRPSAGFLSRLDPSNPDAIPFELKSELIRVLDDTEIHYKECVLGLFTTRYGDTIGQALAQFRQSYSVYSRERERIESEGKMVRLENIVLMFHPNNRTNLAEYIIARQKQAALE